MTIERAIADLVGAGAVMTPTVGGVVVPVGLMLRLHDDRWFWFAAGGETEFDAHTINGAAKVLYDGTAVQFTRGVEFAGYLTIPEEAFDDEPSITSARRTIERWRARYARDEVLRGFIARQVARFR